MSTRALAVFAFAQLALGAAGCMHASDVEIRNPIATRSIDPNRIVKPHDFSERQRGLPPGTMTDMAELVSVDEKRVCVALALKELDPIDLATVEAKLTSPKSDPVEDPQVWPEQPTVQTFSGLVPIRRQVGYETYCASYYSGVCTNWQTRPTYVVSWEPGPVNVYSTGARMCFANRGVAAADTPQITLELRLRRGGIEANRTSGWGLFAGMTKKVVFRWGFGVGKPQG